MPFGQALHEGLAGRLLPLGGTKSGRSRPGGRNHAGGRSHATSELLFRQLNHLANHVPPDGSRHPGRQVAPITVLRNLDPNLLGNLVLELVQSALGAANESTVGLLSLRHCFSPPIDSSETILYRKRAFTCLSQRGGLWQGWMHH